MSSRMAILAGNTYLSSMAKEDAWPLTAKRYVAIIDIMGFKDMVARVPYEDIYKMMRSMEEWRQASMIMGFKDLIETDVKTSAYSDSIMIYSKDDDPRCLLTFSLAVSSFTNTLLTNGIPHKGATAFGLMTVDDKNSIYFGQPLIDAYLLQEELAFYGIVVHATVESELHQSKNSFFPQTFLYPCPFKTGVANHLTVYPMYGRAIPEHIKQNEKLAVGMGKLKLRTSGPLRKYVDNTRTYLEKLNQAIEGKDGEVPEYVFK
jgi:hypothetical protein